MAQKTPNLKRLYLGPQTYWELPRDADGASVSTQVDAAVRDGTVIMVEAMVLGRRTPVRVNGARITSFAVVDRALGQRSAQSPGPTPAPEEFEALRERTQTIVRRGVRALRAATAAALAPDPPSHRGR